VWLQDERLVTDPDQLGEVIIGSRTSTYGREVTRNVRKTRSRRRSTDAGCTA
jgi:hypothetical protein